MPLATIVVALALAILPLLTPLVMHPLLDAGQADLWLGVPRAVAHDLSDSTVRDLVLGGSFAVAGPDGSPLYGPDEMAHMRDARTLLWLLLGAGAVSGVALAVGCCAGRIGSARGAVWLRGGALAVIGTLVIGAVGVVAFDPLFELFHSVFFPGGNWAFDPAASRLVRLYPYAFWELAATLLGVGVVVLGSLAWIVGRRMGRAE